MRNYEHPNSGFIGRLPNHLDFYSTCRTRELVLALSLDLIIIRV